MNAMGIVKRGTTSVVIEIAEGPSVRIVEQAVRRKAVVVFRPVGDRELSSMTGCIVEGTRETLSVQIEEGIEETSVRGAHYDAVLKMDGQEYFFGADILSVAEQSDGWLIQLNRPTMLQMWQRRKFIRAKVADSTTVGISAAGEFERTKFEGAMLNVSEDGLACRVEKAVADYYAVDEVVGLKFKMQDCEKDIACNAKIKAKTPGGTPGTIILGMQFELSSMSSSERADLSSALQINV